MPLRPGDDRTTPPRRVAGTKGTLVLFPQSGDGIRDLESFGKEIGTFLANTSQTTASQAERQFGDIRNSISSERDRTVELLRTAYEQASAEIGRL